MQYTWWKQGSKCCDKSQCDLNMSVDDWQPWGPDVYFALRRQKEESAWIATNTFQWKSKKRLQLSTSSWSVPDVKPTATAISIPMLVQSVIRRRIWLETFLLNWRLASYHHVDQSLWTAWNIVLYIRCPRKTCSLATQINFYTEVSLGHLVFKSLCIYVKLFLML